MRTWWLLAGMVLTGGCAAGMTDEEARSAGSGCVSPCASEAQPAGSKSAPMWTATGSSTEPATATPTGSSTSTTRPTETSSPTPNAGLPPSASPTYVLEPPYPAGSYPWPSDPADRKARIAELERWNAGGLGEGVKWHAAPRIVISEPVVIAGKIDARGAMRKLRAEQYWTVRRCYEARLRDDPKLEGRTNLKLAIRADGGVSSSKAIGREKRLGDSRKFGKDMSDKEVVRCIASGLRKASVPAPRTRTATLLVSIDVYPGDAPLPETSAPPLAGRADLDDVKKKLGKDEIGLSACFEDARKKHPGLWGRLAMRLDVAKDGDVTDAREIETTFPDSDTEACVEARLEAMTLAAPSSEARVVVAFRWGTPP